MKQKLTIHWDKEGDFLELQFGKPTTAYYKDAGDDLFERKDEETDEIKGYAIFNVQKRKQGKDLVVTLPKSICYEETHSKE